MWKKEKNLKDTTVIDYEQEDAYSCIVALAGVRWRALQQQYLLPVLKKYAGESLFDDAALKNGQTE